MQTKQAICTCGRNLGARRVDSDNEHVTHGTCPHCKKRYTIVAGKGQIRVTTESK